MPQIRISVSDELLELLQKECKEYGFQHPAQFASSLILDGYDNFDDTKYKELAESAREYLKIGKSANKMAGRKFSIARAVMDHRETVEGYSKALEAGWIDEDRYEELVTESEREHKKNVKSELKKMDLEKRRRKKNIKKKSETKKKQLIKKINKRRVEKDKLPYTKKTLRSMSIKELRRKLEVLK